MKKLILIFVLLLTIPTFAATDQSREVLPDFSEASLPVLNDILNNIRDTTNVAYPISIANGGTGSATKNFVDLTTAQSVGGVKSFTSFPATPSSAPTTDYQVANKKYVDDSVGGVSSSGFSNVIFQWMGNDWIRTGSAGLNINSSSTTDTTTANFKYMYFTNDTTANFVEHLKGKFTKVVGISTITAWVRLYTNNAGEAKAPRCKVLIGSSLNVIIASANGDAGGTTPAWYSGTIDISSLTSGTTYDISIQIAGDSTATVPPFLSAVTLMGS